MVVLVLAMQENDAMSGPRSLQGIRVMDLSWVRAGPWAARWLGAIGAEIDQDRVAGKRAWPPDEHHHAAASPGQFEHLGQLRRHERKQEESWSKLRNPKGLEIVKRLIAIRYIVAENICTPFHNSGDVLSVFGKERRFTRQRFQTSMVKYCPV
jgi:crotonobetainyl-CoA:carnitine CoA-transferase CaiB-like acyl-CoA transferase